MSLRKESEISGHAGAIYSCLTHGNHIYSGSADKYVARWLIDQGIQDKFAIRFEQSVYALEMMEESILVVGLADGSLHFFDLVANKELKYFVQHKKGIFSIKYNSIHKQIYVGDADGNLSIWNFLSSLRLIMLIAQKGFWLKRPLRIMNVH